jgi:hypothetical protein
MLEVEMHSRSWHDGLLEMDAARPYPRTNKVTVIWYHDESTFYANDRRDVGWVYSKATAKPRAKGEGASLMVAEFVSADYGWLRSPNGSETARVLFRAGAGAGREGYFDNNDILAHARTAMDILAKHYLHERHVLVFDNATSHLKRADDALSARHMSKKPTLPRFQMWGVDANDLGPDGKPTYDSQRKLVKQRICMGDATLADGTPQALYFDPEDGTGRTCVFKGPAQCKGFKCAKGTARCCTRRLLWNQPDFVSVKSLLELECEQRGFTVVFLPKFHCEVNFIERCWSYAKRTYRMKPPSSAQDDLVKNVVDALDGVPLETMRRCESGFVIRTLVFRL